MHLPLGRPLRYRDYPFVQPVRGTRDAIPRLEEADVVSPNPVPLIDDLSTCASATFDPSLIHPRLRGFFESPCTSMMMDQLRWEPWALGLAAVYVPIAAALNNLRVLDRVDRPRAISSSVRAVRLPDGSLSREWVRTFSGTGELFYAAAARPWCDATASYLSMAFPFGMAHLMVLLRFRRRSACLELSTRGDALAGTYIIVPRRRRFVALPGPPTDEVLTYQVTDDGIAVLHEDFVGRRRTFAMRYRVPA